MRIFAIKQEAKKKKERGFKFISVRPFATNIALNWLGKLGKLLVDGTSGRRGRRQQQRVL